MEDSKPLFNLRILIADLEDIKKNYNYLFGNAIKFIHENPHGIDKHNRLEYDVLYKNLWNFYEMVINTSYLDLSKFSINERLYLVGKKEFANKTKISLSAILMELDELKYLDEKNPFY